MNNKEHLKIDDLPKESRELKEDEEKKTSKNGENKSTIQRIVMFRRLAFPAFEVSETPAETGIGRRRVFKVGPLSASGIQADPETPLAGPRLWAAAGDLGGKLPGRPRSPTAAGSFVIARD